MKYIAIHCEEHSLDPEEVLWCIEKSRRTPGTGSGGQELSPLFELDNVFGGDVCTAVARSAMPSG
ncbi:hypothetical protein [Streptomyces cacaoi]|uniref:Uncharacterized protein n=1 Tax=Streptomyces cacaoi TaxID=1898 RepID=A0A4Y3R0H2_STRCI|nr:hypothetical protein [Streptomyces cacaoi]GEB50417.1 hypothetical protein SCA03_29680 [Streptomyces cacaoi]